MPIVYDPTTDALLRPELRQTVFKDGSRPEPVALAVEAARLAYYRFNQSAAELARLNEALARVGFSPAQVFSSVSFIGSEAFGAVRASDQTALLAFRGTQPDKLADLGTNVNAMLAAWQLGQGRVHFGFQSAYLAHHSDISSWLNGPAAGTRRIFSGHSLGAAIACLCASVFQPDLLVTLGGPRLGDEKFLSSISQVDWTRLINCCDVVTRVPPKLVGYAHPRFRSYITRDGIIHQNPTDAFVAVDREVSRLDYLVNHAWHLGTLIVRDLADHAPINYARAFF